MASETDTEKDRELRELKMQNRVLKMQLHQLYARLIKVQENCEKAEMELQWYKSTHTSVQKELVDTKDKREAEDVSVGGDHKKMKLMWNPAFSYGTITVASDDKLSKQVLGFYEKHHETREVFDRKKKIVSEFEALCTDLFPESTLYWTGSSVSNSATTDSDLDIVICMKDEIKSREVKLDVLIKLENEVISRGFDNEPAVVRANVPILKVKYRDICIDIGVDSPQSISNTYLVASYLLIDERIRIILIILKCWASKNKIGSSKDGTMSSFCIALMLIHFLQYKITPPLLPCLHSLHPELFLCDVESFCLYEPSIEFHSLNKTSLGTILQKFFDYFSEDFDYNKVISVKHGILLDKPESESSNEWKFLCVEDPSRLTNVAIAVRKLCAFNKIKEVFTKSAIKLRETNNLLEIFCTK